MTRKQMQRWFWIALALVVLGVFKLGVLWYGWTGEAKPATAEMLACPDTASRSKSKSAAPAKHRWRVLKCPAWTWAYRLIG